MTSLLVSKCAFVSGAMLTISAERHRIMNNVSCGLCDDFRIFTCRITAPERTPVSKQGPVRAKTTVIKRQTRPDFGAATQRPPRLWLGMRMHKAAGERHRLTVVGPSRCITADVLSFPPVRPSAPPAPDSSDQFEPLLPACRTGDPDAWQRMVERFERLVYAIPLRMGLSHSDADDVFQATFIALAQSLDAIRDEKRLGGWLATVARHHSWRVLRRSKMERPFTDFETPDSELDRAAMHETAHILGTPGAASVETYELALWLDGGLQQLSERCRELLQALYLDPRQPSYTEIVADLHIPLGSIGPTRARCLEQLKGVLQPDQS